MSRAPEPRTKRTRRILRAMFVDVGPTDETHLPAELEARAVERLRWLVLGIGALFLLSVPLRWLTTDHEQPELLAISTVVAGLFAVLSVIVAGSMTFARLPPARVLQAGLVYEVLLCFALALVEQILVGFSPMPFRLSLVAVVLLVFPLVVASPPRWRLLATGLAALTQPAALALVSLLSDGALRPLQVVSASAPTLLIAGVAAWLGQVVHQLRLDASEALAFGHYELVRQLGEGGMGEVWEARHTQLLRPAAIKLIRPETAGVFGEAAKARFRREAQATAALSSPHTVGLFDYGTTDDGTLYYAMERLSGIDLESFVQRFGPMPAPRVLYVLQQVVASLAEAHELGLIHRDIKPANVLLCRVGLELDFVKVLDFGLVKPLFLAEDSPVSVAGAVSGTAGYVAPEHAAGRPYDARADLYSLGCVAYFLLSGQRVFSGRTKMELLSAHLGKDPIAPSRRARGLGIPEVLDELVLELLCRDPDQRPRSARELGDRIEQLRGSLDCWDATAARRWWEAHLPELSRPPERLIL